jgi:hypothetical protein
MTVKHNGDVGDEAGYKKHLTEVLDRLAAIDGKDTSLGAVVCFVDKKAQAFSIHGVNLDSSEVKAVFMLATADPDMRLDLDRIRAQLEKEITQPPQH